MDSTTRRTEEIDIFFAFREPGPGEKRAWLKLPHVLMNAAGPAAQSLAGMHRYFGSRTETFASAEKIAAEVMVPTRAFRNHLRKLEAGEWVKNKGRQKDHTGYARRTPTLALTPQTLALFSSDQKTPYGVLPDWACDDRFPWSARAVLSVVMAQLMKLNSKFDGDDPWGELENFGGPERFYFSISDLQECTGLARKAAVAGRRCLVEYGVVRRIDPDARNLGAILYPSEHFRPGRMTRMAA